MLGAAVASHANYTERRAVEADEPADLGSNLKQAALVEPAACLVHL